MADLSEELRPLRGQIDKIDQEIQKLINERAKCAMDVAKVKIEHEGVENAIFYRPEREAQVLRKVMDRNEGPLGDEDMAKLFREIMSCCLALENPMKVAYLGPAGTFTHSAAIKHFGHSVKPVALSTIDEVFREVEAGAANYGVVPVENSTEGMVNHTLDTFMQSSLKIIGEVELRIHHHLLLSDVSKPGSITRIYSHQQSLAQCRKWLDSHYPGVERVAVSSNSEAAKRIKDEWHAAAIAGDMAAELYDLQKLEQNIEDNPDNTTRFLIIGSDYVPPSGTDKTSIIVSTRNKPGALYSLLRPFHEKGISLTRIETRPAKHATWSYVFFIDFEGHLEDPTVKEVLTVLEEDTDEFTVLGSYPVAVL